MEVVCRTIGGCSSNWRQSFLLPSGSHGTSMHLFLWPFLVAIFGLELPSKFSSKNEHFPYCTCMLDFLVFWVIFIFLLLQLQASTNQELNQEIPHFNLPSKIFCRVVNIQLLVLLFDSFCCCHLSCSFCC